MQQFQKGDPVVYGNNGVCLIEGIEKLRYSSSSPAQSYYILNPVDHSSKIFLPIKNEDLTKKIRPIIKRQEIEDILTGATGEKIDWIEDKNERNACFSKIIRECIPQKLICMVRCIFLRKQNLQKDGKKISSTDETVLKSAEKLIREEISYSLEIAPEKVDSNIRSVVNA